MKFQNLKRISCVLLAALILCTAVVEPIEASATSILGSGIFGVNALSFVASALAAFGVLPNGDYSSSDFSYLIYKIVADLPDEFIGGLYMGDTLINVLLQDGITYAPRRLLEWIYNYIVTPDASTGTTVISYDWATGFEEHVSAVTQLLASEGYTLSSFDRVVTRALTDSDGDIVPFFWLSSGFNYPSVTLRHENDVDYLDFSTNYDGVLVYVSCSTNSATDEKTYRYRLFVNPKNSSFHGIIAHELVGSYAFDSAVADDTLTIDRTKLGLAFSDSAYAAVAGGVLYPGSGSSSEDEEGLPLSVPIDYSDITGLPWENIVSGKDTTADLVTPDVDIDVEGINGIANVVTAIYEFLGRMLTSLLDAITGLFSGLASFLQTLVELARSVLASVQTIATTGLNYIYAIPEAILSGIRAIFVPSTDYLTVKVDALRLEFSFVDSIVRTAQFLNSGLAGVTTEPPVIYINLDAQEGFHNIGGTVPFLDLRWYERYKPTVDVLISAFLWICFVWRMFIKLPGIISGMPGDFVMSGVHSLGLDNHLPTRNALYEVQRQSNREMIRKGPNK